MFRTIKARGTEAASSRLWVFLLLVSVAVVFAGACVTGASASPTAASGTFATASIVSFDLVRSADGNDFFDVTGTTAWTGTFSGTSTEVGTVTFHPGGNDNFHAVSTFTGTVNGTLGTVTFELMGRNGPDAVVRATATIIDATGGLAGLRGVLTWNGTVGPDGPLGTYSGQIEFLNP
jgi:hypothetical protein